MSRGHDLRRLAELSDRHLGRTLTLPGGMTGTLTGVIPLKGTVQLALIVGRARCFTDALDGGLLVEVHAKEKAS